MKDKVIKDIDEKNNENDLNKIFEDCEPTEVEQLSDAICYMIADLAANRFKEMTKELDQKKINVLARGIDRCRPVEAIALLKMFFLVAGDKSLADIMDIIDMCADYDEIAYDLFFDSFADTDIMDWNLVDSWLEDECGDEWDPIKFPE